MDLSLLQRADRRMESKKRESATQIWGLSQNRTSEKLPAKGFRTRHACRLTRYMKASPQIAVARRLHRNWNAIVVVVLLLVSIMTMISFSISAKRRAEETYIVSFTASFNSGAAELCSTPEIALNRGFPIPAIWPAKMLKRVDEYSITAQFSVSGVKQWGRWFYTCNAGDWENYCISKFSRSTAATRSALPVSPGLAHTDIPAAIALVDGVPTTAGATVTKVTISSPVKVSDQLVVTAAAPANTTCRIEVFPPTAVISIPAPARPSSSGTVKWSLSLAPTAAGSRISIAVHCEETRGTRLLSNVALGMADITP